MPAHCTPAFAKTLRRPCEGLADVVAVPRLAHLAGVARHAEHEPLSAVESGALAEALAEVVSKGECPVSTSSLRSAHPDGSGIEVNVSPEHALQSLGDTPRGL